MIFIRCPPIEKPSESCVEIPDPKDTCCKTILCDVTLGDMDHEKDMEEMPKTKLLSAQYLNDSSIKLNLDKNIDLKEHSVLVELSHDKNEWESYLVPESQTVFVKHPDFRYIKLDNSDEILSIKSNEEKLENIVSDSGRGCKYKEVARSLGEEFHDECESFCVCKESGVKCLKIECPTFSGVDVLDPSCIEWDTMPSNFTAKAPNCCPEKVVCKNNGSCEYEGQMFANWQQIPENITGCEKRCYCEMGKIECQNVCPPVPGLPPPNLNCPNNQIGLGHQPGDDCCKFWVCSKQGKRTIHYFCLLLNFSCIFLQNYVNKASNVKYLKQ